MLLLVFFLLFRSFTQRFAHHDRPAFELVESLLKGEVFRTAKLRHQALAGVLLGFFFQTLACLLSIKVALPLRSALEVGHRLAGGFLSNGEVLGQIGFAGSQAGK